MRTRVGLSLAIFPGLAFISGIWFLHSTGRMPGLSASSIPWELWCIAVFGTTALMASAGDWAYHTFVLQGKVSTAEDKVELLALGFGGLPMFILMALASLSYHPQSYLIPIVTVLMFTVVMICKDEFMFHTRRCKAFENWLHEIIVFGNGIAWLSWFHWIFVRARA